MQQSVRKIRGAAEETMSRGPKKLITADRGKDGSPPPAPFSPFGRHAVLKGLLLRVGGELARDEEGSLSRVSLGALRSALSDFLREAGATGANRYVSSGGSTSRRSGSRGTASGLTKEDREKLRKKAARREWDRKTIERLGG